MYRAITFPVNHDKKTLKNHERKKKPFFVKLQANVATLTHRWVRNTV